VFTNQYFIALGIPLVLLLCGAVAKKLVRGSAWQRSDFYLGVEFTLAAMSSALVYVFDLVKVAGTDNSAPVAGKMAATGSYLALCFFLLLWVLSTHQDWERRDQNPHGQLVWLCIVANIVGAGLLSVFILLVKGI